MNIREFLKPRYEFIKDYPGSPFIVGTVLDAFEHGSKILLHDNDKLEPKLFPDNFKKLRWWEHRTIEQLVSIRYMKIISGSNYYVKGDVVEVKEVHYNNKNLVEGRNAVLFNLGDHYFAPSQVEPCSEEGYDQYLLSNNGKYH